MALPAIIFLLLSLFLNLTTAFPLSNQTIFTPPQLAGPHRRGIAYNNPNFVQLFNTPNNLASWCYNWAPTTGGTNTPFEYVPMLWGDRDTGGWWSAVQRAAGAQIDSPTHLLGFNEPDNCQSGAGGSCMSVASAVTAWRQHMEPAKSLKDKMYLGSPAVTNGANGMGIDWLREFMSQCDGCSIDFICLHWYDSALNAAYFKSHISKARDLAAGRPIWITEFYPSGTDDEIKAFLADVIPWMDQSGDVHRYALFMAREGMLVNPWGNGLSEIGKAFVEGGDGGKSEGTSEKSNATDKTSKDVTDNEPKASEAGLDTKRFFSRAEAAIIKAKGLGKRSDTPCIKCRSADVFNDCWWTKCQKHD